MSGRDWVRRLLFGTAGVLTGAAIVLAAGPPTEAERLPAVQQQQPSPTVTPRGALNQDAVGTAGVLTIPGAGLAAPIDLLEVPSSGVISPPSAASAFQLTGMPPAWPEQVLALHSSRSHDPQAAVGNHLLDEAGAPRLALGEVVWVGTERFTISAALAVPKGETSAVLASHPEAAAAIVTCAQEDAGSRPAGTPAASNAIFFLEAAPL